MKALYTIKVFTVAFAALLVSSCSPDQIAQTSEYDDMYFTAHDRTLTASTQTVPYTGQQSRSREEDYSSKTVNPEYIARSEERRVGKECRSQGWTDTELVNVERS